MYSRGKRSIKCQPSSWTLMIYPCTNNPPVPPAKSPSVNELEIITCVLSPSLKNHYLRPSLSEAVVPLTKLALLCLCLSGYTMSNDVVLLQEWEGRIVPRAFSVGYIVLSYLVSFVGAWTTLELINRRTGGRGLYNWFA